MNRPNLSMAALVRAFGRPCAGRGWGVLMAACVLCLLGVLPAWAQATPDGSLIITVSAVTKLTFAFENAPSPGTLGTCAITGAGTTAATLNLGTASIAGHNATCVSFTAGSGNRSYTLANSVYINVSEGGSKKSTSYTLTAKLAAAPPTGIAWTADSLALSTTAATLTTTGAYGTSTPVSLATTVQGTVTTTAISQAIDFVATAN